jgi:hypothetical protein
MGGMFMLGFFMIVVGLPVIGGLWLSHQKDRMKLRERELEALDSQAAQLVAQCAAQTERLEQRVRVLERIVTDKGFGLAADIDRLGDDRAAAE